MSIRLRIVSGVRVALCANETDEETGDVYLDDGEHYALAAKFARDWKTGVEYPDEWNAMDSQKRRDAEEELHRWLDAQSAPDPRLVPHPDGSPSEPWYVSQVAPAWVDNGLPEVMENPAVSAMERNTRALIRLAEAIEKMNLDR